MCSLQKVERSALPVGGVTARISDETWVAFDALYSGGPLRTASEYELFERKDNLCLDSGYEIFFFLLE